MIQILVVDDENSLREILAMYLSSHGYSVRQACNGDQGLEYFRERGPFACVVSDFQMYGEKIKNGVEMLHAIRQEAPEQKCILQSASWSLGELMELRGLGDVPILHKPYKLQELLDQLNR